MTIIAGALGTVALLRARSIKWPWAILGGVAFLFFGGFAGQATHMHHFRGFALYPWLLWSVTDVRSGPSGRLLGLPLVAWLLAAGAYPGQLPVFVLLAAVYVVADYLQGDTGPSRQRIVMFGLSVAAAGLIVGAVVWPFLLAESSDLLFRATLPSVEKRAGQAFWGVDFLGLYLDRWTFLPGDGSTKSWSVGIPVLIGLAGLTREHLRRLSPVVWQGVVGIGLAVLPRFEAIGEVMVSLGPVFSSRFPSADAKVAPALALIVLAIVGWRSLLSPDASRKRLAIVVAIGLILTTGLWIAEEAGTGRATDSVLPTIGIIAITVALAIWRPPATIAFVALFALLAADGTRIMTDMDFDANRTGVALSPWETYLSDEGYQQREDAARAIKTTLTTPVTTRPARVKPFRPVEGIWVQGAPRDALGFLGTGYNMSSYSGHLTAARWEALTDRDSFALMAMPWTAWVIPCTSGSCLIDGALPPQNTWLETEALTTTNYGLNTVTYETMLTQRSLVIENEINYPGWTSSNANVTSVTHDGSFRAWIVEPGSYSFTTQFIPMGRTLQLLMAGVAALLWFALVVVARREPLLTDSDAAVALRSDT
ncbi:MAG: hypothetical protein HKN91_02490 [Acidimicrobiia bacterium]|nr:hypothetical protein [Acidimicrobiia bacterium]